MNALKFKCLYMVPVLLVMALACNKIEDEPERFNIDATELILADYKAGFTDILLSTNRDPLAYVEETAQDWLSAEITRRCLTVTYKENTVESERSGKVNIEAGSIRISVLVTQPAYVVPEPEPPVDDDTYELYDLYYENGKAAGVVFWVSEDKKSALVISLDRSETTLPWSYDGSNVIGTGLVNGAENTALCRASDEAASIPALEFCNFLGEGWYWPAMQEMMTLFETYNGTPYTEGKHNVVPANLPEEQKESRAKFDKILVDNGGIALNTAPDTENGDQYWTSTEQTHKDGITYGSSFRFGKAYASGAADMMQKTKASRYIRAVKAVPYSGGTTPEEPVETKFPVYKEDGRNMGIVYWTSDDGSTSKVLSLQRTDAIAWSYNGENVIGCSSKEDGMENMAKIAESPEAGDMPAYDFCKSLGEGWYWPAINEMSEILGIYNGKPYQEGGNKVPAELSDEEKESRAAFDLSLVTYGGIAMNLAEPTVNGDRYWCSTEYYFKDKNGKEGYYGSFVQFGKAYVSGPADTSGKTQSSGRYARCIKVISNGQ